MKQIKIYVLNQEAVEDFDDAFHDGEGNPTKAWKDYILNHKETESYSVLGFIKAFNDGDISDSSFVLCVQSDEANKNNL
jgi:hypothetical protein